MKRISGSCVFELSTRSRQARRLLEALQRFNISNSCRLFFPQQDHVGGVLGTGDGEGFSIRRPLKFGDVFKSEVGDLVSGRTVERLHKNVIHALIANDVGHGFSIGSGGHSIGEASSASRSYPWIRLEQDGSGLRA